MNREERAKQFMPFSALKGFYELINECEKIKEPKKELSESEAEILSSKINYLKKGMLITVKHYNIDSYEETTGILSSIDYDYKTLTIIKTPIQFDNILNITTCNKNS